MEKAIKTIPLSGEGNNVKTIEQFKEICESEYLVKYNAMVEEYKERRLSLEKRRDRQIQEYTFIGNIANLNSITSDGKNLNPALMMQVEKEIAALDFDNVGASFTLDYWTGQFGEMIVPIVCDVIHYFVKQFQVKEKLTDVEIFQLTTKIIVNQPRLRLMELVYVFREALAGKYGPTYQRIGIDSVLGWLSKFYEDSANHLEMRTVNSKQDESRGDRPWELLERKIKDYETEQRTKKQVVDKVWGIEKRKVEVDNYKAGFEDKSK